MSEFRADDDGRADFVLRLTDMIKEQGFSISTNPADFSRNKPPAFELHIEAQWQRSFTPNQYLLLIEDRHIRPQNYLVRWARYRKVFSWDDDIVRSRGAVKYLFPAHLDAGPVGDFQRREMFMSLVAANKAQAVRTGSDLYRQRVAALSWFQKNAPRDLALFGPGWNLPRHPHGLLAKAAFKLLKKTRVFDQRQIACWKGIAPVKREVLLQSRFNLCYENTSGSRGYISEKIFDAMSTGAVPVYWGAPNITDFVPSACFIDRRGFRSTEDMYRFLKAITPNEHADYQAAMRDFCARNGRRFGIDRFAAHLARHITEDLRTKK